MKGKKAISYVMVSIVLLLVVFVLLLQVQSVAIGIIRGSGEDQACVWSSVMNAYSGGLLTLGKKSIKLKCPMRSVLTTLEKDTKAPKDTFLVNLMSGTYRASRAIKEFHKNFGDRIGKDGITYPYSDDADSQLRWVLDETIAKEMKSCWTKLGQGKLPLFSQDILGWENPDIDPSDSTVEKIVGSIWLPAYEKKRKVYCVLCSRIMFDDSVKEKFPSSVSSTLDLNPWLKNHPVSRSDNTPYYRYLMDSESSDFFGPQYAYSTDTPYAVVFARNMVPISEEIISALGDTFEIVSSGEGKNKHDWAAVDAIYLVPYENVDAYCTDIMN